MSDLNPDERARHQRLGASAGQTRRWALTDAKTKADHIEMMNQARLNRYFEQLDAIGQFSPEERLRRALALRRADMQQLSLRAAKARRANRVRRALDAQDALADQAEEGAA